jgi:hypothetical protein
MVLLAIDEALEAAAEIADQEGSPVLRPSSRSLKWLRRAIALTRASDHSVYESFKAKLCFLDS